MTAKIQFVGKIPIESPQSKAHFREAMILKGRDKHPPIVSKETRELVTSALKAQFEFASAKVLSLALKKLL